jgi:hypothetical protein
MQKFAEPIQTFFLFIHEQPFPRISHDIQIAQKGEALDGTIKGARNVNTKCESELHVSWLASTMAFGQGGFLKLAKLAKLAKVDSKKNPL